MKKKKLIGIVLAIALVLSVGVAAYAASGFTMTYLPGTSDTVTNMPDADSGVGGQPYTVSDKIPQREGYEFLGWTLDYGLKQTYTLTYHVTGDPNYGTPGDTATPDPVTGILEGGSVTLAAPLSYTDTGTKEYTVNYIDEDNNAIKESMVGYAAVGDQVKQNAADISGWKPLDTELPLTIAGDTWVFTGWCSDEACTNPITDVTNISADTDVYGKWVCTPAVNEITFYYKPAANYTVRHVYEDRNGEFVDITDKNGEPYTEYGTGIVGETITRRVGRFAGYQYTGTPTGSITLTRNDADNVIIFIYRGIG